MRTRNTEIDIAKGIALVLMIVGHSFTRHSYLFESFHMPLFFILSGYFYSPITNLELIKKGVKRLWKPFFITIVLLEMVSFAMGVNYTMRSYFYSILFPDGIYTSNLTQIWPDAGALWFLAALFWCRIIFNTIYKHFQNNSTYIEVCLVVAVLSVYIGHNYVFNLPFGILIGCSGIFFYCIGQLCKQYNIFEKRIPIVYILMFIPTWYYLCEISLFRMFAFGYGGLYLINVASAIIMVVFIVKFSRVIINYTPTLPSLFKIIGEESLVLLCWHEICRNIINNIIALGWEPSTGQAGRYLLSSSIFIGLIIVSSKRVYRNVSTK